LPARVWWRCLWADLVSGQLVVRQADRVAYRSDCPTAGTASCPGQWLASGGRRVRRAGVRIEQSEQVAPPCGCPSGAEVIDLSVATTRSAALPRCCPWCRFSLLSLVKPAEPKEPIELLLLGPAHAAPEVMDESVLLVLRPLISPCQAKDSTPPSSRFRDCVRAVGAPVTMELLVATESTEAREASVPKLPTGALLPIELLVPSGVLRLYPATGWTPGALRGSGGPVDACRPEWTHRKQWNC
jgi:hypothetical protein